MAILASHLGASSGTSASAAACICAQLPSKGMASGVVACMGVCWAAMGGALLFITPHLDNQHSKCGAALHFGTSAQQGRLSANYLHDFWSL